MDSSITIADLMQEAKGAEHQGQFDQARDQSPQ